MEKMMEQRFADLDTHRRETIDEIVDEVVKLLKSKTKSKR